MFGAFFGRWLGGSIDENPRCVYVIGVERAKRADFLDFGHGDAASGGDHRVEVSGGLSVHEIA